MMYDFLKVDDSQQPIGTRGYQVPTQLLLLLRTYFTNTYPKWLPDLDRFNYTSPDGPITASQNVSAIEITRLGEERSELTDLPKLLVRRDALADMTRGLREGQRMLPAMQSVYETVSVGSITIFGMSRRLGESEMLAFEVFELLRHFRTGIRKKLCLTKLKANQVGAPGRLRGFPNFFATPLTLDYSYQDNIRVTSDKIPIRELKLEIE